jgi:hypothetical protein
MVVLTTSFTRVNHYTTLCKHSTDSTPTFTALRHVNTTPRNDKLPPCLLVVDWVSTPESPSLWPCPCTDWLLPLPILLFRDHFIELTRRQCLPELQNIKDETAMFETHRKLMQI